MKERSINRLKEENIRKKLSEKKMHKEVRTHNEFSDHSDHDSFRSKNRAMEIFAFIVMFLMIGLPVSMATSMNSVEVIFVNQTSARINTTTDEDVRAEMIYSNESTSLMASYVNAMSSPMAGLGREHLFSLDNLMMNTTYYFVINTTNLSDYSQIHNNGTEFYTFKTADNSSSELFINVTVQKGATNNKELFFEGETLPNATVMVHVNDDSMMNPQMIHLPSGNLVRSITDEEGEFSGSVLLSFDENEVVFKAVKGFEKAYQNETIRYDSFPPKFDWRISDGSRKIFRSEKQVLSGSTNEKVEVVVKSEALVLMNFTVDTGTFTRNLTFPDVAEGTEKEYPLELRVADEAGNEVLFSDVITIDKKPPEIEITTNLDNEFHEIGAKIEGITDPHAKLEVTNIGDIEGERVLDILMKEPCTESLDIMKMMTLDKTEWEKFSKSDCSTETTNEMESWYEEMLAKKETEVQFDPFNLIFGDIIKDVESDKDGEFTLRVNLMEEINNGENKILIKAKDRAGNVGTRLITMMFVPGDPNWKISRVTVYPNTVDGQQLMKEEYEATALFVMRWMGAEGDAPRGMDDVQHQIMADSQDKGNNNLVSFNPDGKGYYDPAKGEYMMMATVDIKKIPEEPGQSTKEALDDYFDKLSKGVPEWYETGPLKIDGIRYLKLHAKIRMDYNSQYSESRISEPYVFTEYGYAIERPENWADWLSPEMIDRMLVWVKDAINIVERLKIYSLYAFAASLLGCVAAVALNYLSGFASASGSNTLDQSVYWTCDRVLCPTVPIDCEGGMQPGMTNDEWIKQQKKALESERERMMQTVDRGFIKKDGVFIPLDDSASEKMEQYYDEKSASLDKLSEGGLTYEELAKSDDSFWKNRYLQTRYNYVNNGKDSQVITRVIPSGSEEFTSLKKKAIGNTNDCESIISYTPQKKSSSATMAGSMPMPILLRSGMSFLQDPMGGASSTSYAKSTTSYVCTAADPFGNSDLDKEIFDMQTGGVKTSAGLGCYTPETDDSKCLWQSSPNGEINPSEGIFNSIRCGCFPGMYAHFTNLLKILNGMKKCLESAKLGEVRSGLCQEMFLMLLCDVLIGVFKFFFGTVTEHIARPGANDPISNYADNAKRLKNTLSSRYKDSANTLFGGMTVDQIAHKACLAAFTGDIEFLKGMLQNYIEEFPVDPTIHVMGKSRPAGYNPFTGEVRFNYNIYVGIVPGGDLQIEKFEMRCDKNFEGGQYCPSQVKTYDLMSESGIPRSMKKEDDLLDQSFSVTDDNGQYWYNMVYLKVSYETASGQQESQEWTEPISKNQLNLPPQCKFSPMTGFHCSTQDISDSGIVKLEDCEGNRQDCSRLSPDAGGREYYPGNSLASLVKLRNSLTKTAFLTFNITGPATRKLFYYKIQPPASGPTEGNKAVQYYNLLLSNFEESNLPAGSGNYLGTINNEALFKELTSSGKDLYVKAPEDSTARFKISYVVSSEGSNSDAVPKSDYFLMDGFDGTYQKANLYEILEQKNQRVNKFSNVKVYSMTARSSNSGVMGYYAGTSSDSRAGNEVALQPVQDSPLESGSYNIRVNIYEDTDEDNTWSEGDYPLYYDAESQVWDPYISVNKGSDGSRSPNVDIIEPIGSYIPAMKNPVDFEGRTYEGVPFGANIQDDMNDIKEIVFYVKGENGMLKNGYECRITNPQKPKCEGTKNAHLIVDAATPNLGPVEDDSSTPPYYRVFIKQNSPALNAGESLILVVRVTDGKGNVAKKEKEVGVLRHDELGKDDEQSSEEDSTDTVGSVALAEIALRKAPARLLRGEEEVTQDEWENMEDLAADILTGEYETSTITTSDEEESTSSTGDQTNSEAKSDISKDETASSYGNCYMMDYPYKCKDIYDALRKGKCDGNNPKVFTGNDYYYDNNQVIRIDNAGKKKVMCDLNACKEYNDRDLLTSRYDMVKEDECIS